MMMVINLPQRHFAQHDHNDVFIGYNEAEQNQIIKIIGNKFTAKEYLYESIAFVLLS